MKQPYHVINNMKIFIAMANKVWNIDVESNELLQNIADYLGQFCMNASLMCPTIQFNKSNNIDDSVFKKAFCWHSLCIMLSLL